MSRSETLEIGQLCLRLVEGSDTLQCAHCGHETGAGGARYACSIGEKMMLSLSGPGPGAAMWCPSLDYTPPREQCGRGDSFHNGGLPGSTPLDALRRFVRTLDQSATDAERDAVNLRHMHKMLAAQVPTEEQP